MPLADGVSDSSRFELGGGARARRRIRSTLPPAPFRCPAPVSRTWAGPHPGRGGRGRGARRYLAGQRGAQPVVLGWGGPVVRLFEQPRHDGLFGFGLEG